ncbi:MAG: hypothetical protein H7Y11_04980, partial [Armatimonadetes bacterium]|nr:hypothetical protein [Anaerolineae bacterium]
MDFLLIFVRPPGDLLYFLAIAALSLACAALAFGQRLRHPDDFTAQRYQFATFGVVAAWGLLLLGALASLLLNLEARLVLPPLERAAMLLTVLLLAWVFLSADHARWGRTPIVVLALLMALTNIGYVLTAAGWAQAASTQTFADSFAGLMWLAVTLVLLLMSTALAVIFFRWVVDAPLKIVFFLTVAVGCAGAMVLSGRGTPLGDYAGAVRLSFSAGMALALVLVYRAMQLRLEANLQLQYTQPAFSTQPIAPIYPLVYAVPEPVPGSDPLLSPNPVAPEKITAPPPQRESVQLLRILGLMLEDAEPENIPWQVVKVALEALRAEIGAILRLKDANYADITAIYDRSMRRTTNGVSLNLDNQPTLVNAIERRTQRPLLVDRNPDELNDLYTRLGVSQVGPVYLQPLIHDQELVAVLM